MEVALQMILEIVANEKLLTKSCFRLFWSYFLPKLLHWLFPLQSTLTRQLPFSTYPDNFMAGRRSFLSFILMSFFYLFCLFIPLSDHIPVWLTITEHQHFFSNHEVNDQLQKGKFIWRFNLPAIIWHCCTVAVVSTRLVMIRTITITLIDIFLWSIKAWINSWKRRVCLFIY